MCLGIVMKVEKINGNKALCDYFGNKRNIRIDVIKNVKIGDYLLIHAGFAIGKLTKEEGDDHLKFMWELEEKLKEV